MTDARSDLFYIPSARNGRLGVLQGRDGGAYVCIDGASHHHQWDWDVAINYMHALEWWLDQEADE